MAEWIIAGLLGGILSILYVELRAGARLRHDLTREIDKLDRRMEMSHGAIVRNTDRMASDVRALRRVVEGEGT